MTWTQSFLENEPEPKVTQSLGGKKHLQWYRVVNNYLINIIYWFCGWRPEQRLLAFLFLLVGDGTSSSSSSPFPFLVKNEHFNYKESQNNKKPFIDSRLSLEFIRIKGVQGESFLLCRLRCCHRFPSTLNEKFRFTIYVVNRLTIIGRKKHVIDTIINRLDCCLTI